MMIRLLLTGCTLLMLNKKVNAAEQNALNQIKVESKTMKTTDSKQYNFFIDDCIFFLNDIAKNKQPSLFNHFFLKGLKDLNKRYGAKFTLNLFYLDERDGFTLAKFPDSYKSEWQANADWLRLSFHAYSENPPNPYSTKHKGKLAEHYDLVKNEIIRFAGSETLIPPVIIHYFAVGGKQGIEVLKARGVRTLTSPKDSISQETSRRLQNESRFFMSDWGINLCKVDLFCNNHTVQEIEQNITKKLSKSQFNSTFNIGTHEQYFYKFYGAYIPDHFGRLEKAIKLLAANDYKPILENSQ